MRLFPDSIKTLYYSTFITNHVFYENNGPSKHTSHSMIYAPLGPRRAPYTFYSTFITNHVFYENNGPSKHTSHSMIYAPISPRRAPYTFQPFYLTNHVFYENNGQSKHTSHSMTYAWISSWARSKADTSNSLSERKIIRWARVYSSLLVDGIVFYKRDLSHSAFKF